MSKAATHSITDRPHELQWSNPKIQSFLAFTAILMHLNQLANVSLKQKHEKLHAKMIFFLKSQEIFIVHDLVPLVPVGAFSAVLHSCGRKETSVRVIPSCAQTHKDSKTNSKSAAFTQWSPHRFAGGSIQHGLLSGDADFDVNVSHRASIQLWQNKTGEFRVIICFVYGSYKQAFPTTSGSLLINWMNDQLPFKFDWLQTLKFRGLKY